MAQPEDIQRKLKKKRNRELLAYFRELWAKEGLFYAIDRTLQYLKRRSGGKRGRLLPKAAELTRQREADTTGWPKISVVVPVYNVARQYFAELLSSVVAQTYPNWELCIANASDMPEVIRELVARHTDERIRMEDIANEGIAANTNQAARMATGQYLAFLDHDDLLAPHALFEMAQRISKTEAQFIYSDEALFTNDYRQPTAVHFKPDYSPQYLLNVNYIAHLSVVKTELFRQLGGFNLTLDGAQDLDLYLRVLEVTGTAEHVQKVLYYWRQHAQSTSTGVAAKPYVADASKRAIDTHLARIGVRGTAADGLFPSTYRVNYAIRGLPLVSIIIPSYEHVDDLDRCINSIIDESVYRQYEILIIENNSKTVETFEYYDRLVARQPACKVLVYDEGGGFNFSKLCNFGRKHAKGDYLLFLNNDTKVISPYWINEMLQLCQLDSVGAVGAMLYYPDDTVQHAGVVVGLGGYAGHSHKYAIKGKSGYMFRQACVQELSAVTAACMMVGRRAYDAVGGFDEWFSVAYNDVDLCLRLRRKGYSILFTPYAELYHYESKSRGSDETGAARLRFETEQERLLERYGDELLHDPYYNPWLTKDREDFSEADAPPRDPDQTN